MKVRAIKPCFVDGHRRRVGEVFDYEVKSGAKVPGFMERVGDDAEVGRARVVATPPKQDTVSQLARRTAPRTAQSGLGMPKEVTP